MGKHFTMLSWCKYSDTFWLADRTRLFVQYTIPLSSFSKLIWRHWTYKMQIYFVECVSKIKHIFSVIHYTICGAVCFQFTHFPCGGRDNTCQIYFVECVSKIKHILSVIHYTICGAVCFQFTHFPCGDRDNTLSYYHLQIGSMNYYPLFRVKSWNNGVRCMSFYIIKVFSWEETWKLFFSYWLKW